MLIRGCLVLTSGDFCFHICFNLTHLSSHLAPMIGFSQVGECFETHSPQERQEANGNGMDRASEEAVVKSFGLSVQKTGGRLMANWGILALSEVAALLSLLQSCHLDIGAPFLLVWYWVPFHYLSFGMRLCRSLGDTHNQLFLCFPQCPQGFLYLSHTSLLFVSSFPSGGSRLPSLRVCPAAYSLQVPKRMPSGRRWRRLPTEWRFAGYPALCSSPLRKMGKP